MEFNIQQMLHQQLSIPSILMERYTDINLNEKQLALILQIHASQSKGNDFPTPEELAEHVTMDKEECTQILRQLIQQGYLSIEEDQNNERIQEAYSLEPLWVKLFEEDNEVEEFTEDKEIGEIFQRFEREFGRPLSPFEIELINNWIDEENHEISLIYAALREAVLMSKLNLKYIDRILIEWKKKGIHSAVEAKQTSKSFHRSKTKSEVKQNNPYDKSLYYNWLEE
ncbi:DnaD domain-containing protein [Gracilibacillus sp. YIM 98692]|uniref:DnaD domain-containing protein n=1 Tax=Gracilibacillus sp. YIM 98692 TaxID=2663532 RepID=UPI0013D79CEA|nr:DnaD domain-containing protein [Gracilibacillus sp. YIM 98692]